MKLYILGGTAEDISRVTAIAAAEGYDVEDLAQMGRPRARSLVSEVLEGFRRTSTIRGAARRADTSPRTAQRALRYFGMID